jgi:hypothetical protein
MEEKVVSEKGINKEPLQIQRVCSPDHQAMLAALRVVLDLPRKPILLEGEDRS